MTNLPIRLKANVLMLCLVFGLLTNVAMADKVQSHELSDAVLQGNLEKVKTLIAAGVDLEVLDDRMNPNGRYPLNWAAWFDRVEIIKALLDAGADISKPNKTGFTPLHHAIENGSVAAAKLLVERGADLSAVNRYDATPLQFAREVGQNEIADFIIAAQQ